MTGRGSSAPISLQSQLNDEPEGARIGLVIMCSDEAGEAAFKRCLPDNVRVHTTRAALDLEDYLNGRFRPIGGFEVLAATLPAKGRLDLIAFSCTSGAILAGEGFVAKGFERSHPGIPCVDPATSAISGLRGHGAQRLALLTPYPAQVHALLPPYFEGHGFQVVTHGSFDIERDDEVARVTTGSFIDAGRILVSREPVDALFISCTAFNVVGALDEIEAAIGVPVYSSSQLFAQRAIALLDRAGDLPVATG